MKLLTVFGTRPEIIKLAPVIELARKTFSHDALVTCSTGQHQEMLQQTLAVFNMTPDVDLGVMQPQQTLASLSARLMEALTDTYNTHKPDVVMVQGDTTTAFIAALAAFYSHIPVAHVEAGLRTGDMQNPFPEELNRILIARLAKWHFAPTKRAANHLINEGIRPAAITVTGNTVVDALQLLQSRKQISAESLPPTIAHVEKNKLVLVTTHRRENFGGPLRDICTALMTLCTQHPSLTWVFPVHYNPSVREVVFNTLRGLPNLYLLDPIDYQSMLALQSHACLIVTDSGGLQEEAASFGVPVVVMRETTERSESIDAGFATLAGTSPDAIVAAANAYLNDSSLLERLSTISNPYGDGNGSARILAALQGKPVEAFHG